MRPELELEAVCQDLAIFCTLGHFLKNLATINLPKSTTFLGNFCKGVKIYHICSEIIFGQVLQTFGDFFLVTQPMLYSTYSSFLNNFNRKMINFNTFTKIA